MVGLVCTTLYALVPPYMVYAQTTDTFPENLRMPIVGGMTLVLVCMLICRYTNQKPFHRRVKK
jgi:hypothetical protein